MKHDRRHEATRRLRALALTVAMVVVTIGRVAPGATRTWSGYGAGGTGTEWFSLANWNPAGWPDDDDILIISPGESETTSDVKVSDGGEIRMGSLSTVELKELYIGYENDGALLMQNWCILRTENSYMGYLPDSTGSATLDGLVTWTIENEFLVGVGGDADLTITGYGSVKSAETKTSGEFGFVHNDKSVVSRITVDGPDAEFEAGHLVVGIAGQGYIDILNGASMTSSSTHLSSYGHSYGEVTVDGDGSSWITGPLLTSNFGRITITGGGSVVGARTGVGGGGGLGIVSVTDSGSLWDVAGTTFVGGEGLAHTSSGIGQVLLSDGATWKTEDTYVGCTPTSEGYILVSGADTTWEHDTVYIGYKGKGELKIEEGISISPMGEDAYVGYAEGATGAVMLRDANTSWAHLGTLCVGHEGTGEVNIDSGAKIGAAEVNVAHVAGSEGLITVDGADSELDANHLYLGYGGPGEVTAANGALVAASFLRVGGLTAGGSGVLSATGEGTELRLNTVDIASFAGADADGSISLSGGADGSAESITIGYAGSGATASMSLDGAGTEFEVGCCTNVADGLLELSGGASLFGHRSPIYVGMGSGDGEAILSGTDTLLSGDDNVYIGGDTSTGGSGHVSVGEGATLRAAGKVEIGETGALCGSGTVDADTINDGSLGPGCSFGELTVTGDLTLLDSSTLTIEIGGPLPRQFDRLVVGGTATLDGDLVIETANGYAPAPGQTFTIVDATAVSGAFDTISGDRLGGGLSYDVSNAGGDLVFTVVPEPATVALLAGGALLLMGTRMRRRGRELKNAN